MSALVDCCRCTRPSIAGSSHASLSALMVTTLDVSWMQIFGLGLDSAAAADRQRIGGHDVAYAVPSAFWLVLDDEAPGRDPNGFPWTTGAAAGGEPQMEALKGAIFFAASPRPIHGNRFAMRQPRAPTGAVARMNARVGVRRVVQRAGCGQHRLGSRTRRRTRSGSDMDRLPRASRLVRRARRQQHNPTMNAARMEPNSGFTICIVFCQQSLDLARSTAVG